MHVAFFRRDIQIAAQKDICGSLVLLIEQFPQPLHPLQLELVFVGTHMLPVGNVDVDEANAGDLSHQQSRLAGSVITGKTADLIGATGTRNDSHAVITLLAKQQALITHAL